MSTIPSIRAVHRTLSLLVGGMLVASSHAEPASIEVGVRPESVTKGFDGHYFVTIINEGDVPGDGAVRRVTPEGQVEDFVEGLDNPKGIAFVEEHLFTADEKRVWKISAKGVKTLLVEEADFPHPIGMLNDVAVAHDGLGILVTDMGANAKMRNPEGKLWPLESEEAKALPAIGRVYHIDLEGNVTIAVDAHDDMPLPNGVTAPSADEILIGEFFRGQVISVKHGKSTVLASGYRGADGIERDAEGNIYLSSWVEGKVWQLDAEGKNAQVVSEGHQSAADFYLDRETRVIWLPDMLAGTLHKIPLD